jgi:cytochrome c oxidase subunit 3
MDSTAISTGAEGTTWGGGNQPLKSSYGKMMMWFLIV